MNRSGPTKDGRLIPSKWLSLGSSRHRTQGDEVQTGLLRILKSMTHEDGDPCCHLGDLLSVCGDGWFNL